LRPDARDLQPVPRCRYRARRSGAAGDVMAPLAGRPRDDGPRGRGVAGVAQPPPRPDRPPPRGVLALPRWPRRDRRGACPLRVSLRSPGRVDRDGRHRRTAAALLRADGTEVVGGLRRGLRRGRVRLLAGLRRGPRRTGHVGGRCARAGRADPGQPRSAAGGLLDAPRRARSDRGGPSYFAITSPDSEAWIPMLAVGASLLLLFAPYGRRTWAVFGAAGVGGAYAASQLASGDGRAARALIVGAVVVLVGLILDARGRRPVGFWMHVSG